MALRKPFLSLFITMAAAVYAQNNDVTKAYLDNGAFDNRYDYVTSDKGNVAQEILDVYGWEKPVAPNYTIGGVYQFGTKKTFNGAAVPAEGYEGISSGGGLALSTGWDQQLAYSSTVTLPQGKYAIVTAIYNCGDKTAGSSVVGWKPVSGSPALSAVQSFPLGEWLTDTVRFEVGSSSEGTIQVGMKASSNGSANSAKIIIDFVKLLRDTPLGSADIDYRKSCLQVIIAEAEALYSDGTGNSAASLAEAIAQAKNVSAATDATLDDVISSETSLRAAVLSYKYANPSGAIPTVVTNPGYASGSSMAFGRMTISGVTSMDIVEQGFCWSTSPMPTVNDNKTTKYLSNNGRIFWLNHLSPSTVYYMRPYVITSGYALAYGDPIKFATLPRGGVSYSLRGGCPDDFVERVGDAATSAVDYYNALTNIHGLSLSIGYGSGTPTAECSYGGWMTVGPNVSYQKTGTILHEMLHAIGVGTHSYWYGPNSPLRETGESGKWLGVRATKLLRFWDNDQTAMLTGDKVHFWPYGVNGAHEDNGTDLLYIGNALLAQAVGEDGLPPTGGFAVPAYVFAQEDGVRYYIKNESEERGLFSSYLAEDNKGMLTWRTLSTTQATANDSAAWYVSYNPKNCYYQLRNASTGHYITYKSVGVNGIATVSTGSPSTNENFHFLPSHVDVMSDEGYPVNGFWVVHPENNATPKCMSAVLDGKVASVAFSISNASTTQRWIILSADEISKMETAVRSRLSKSVADGVSRLRTLAAVPHNEDVAGTDAQLESSLAAIESGNTAAATIDELNALVSATSQATFDFLANATPKTADNPFDISYFVQNGDISETEGWSSSPTVNYSCAEYYQSQFDFNQTVKNLPAGAYQVKAQAFQRPGTASVAYNGFVNGTDLVSTYLYGNSAKTKVSSIAVGAQDQKMGGSESSVGSGKYIPNDMQSASLYFAASLYDNGVVTSLASDGGSLKIGLMCSESSDYYWTIFDNFRLYYYGSMDPSLITSTGIDDVVVSGSAAGLFSVPADVYSVCGTVVRRGANSLDGLAKGMYIVKGKKMIKN